MSKIVCGRFDRSVDADGALAALAKEGFTDKDVDSFYVGPPGQHDMTPVGGDSPHASEGSQQAGYGGLVGAVIGAIVGAAAGWVVSGEYGLVALFLAAGLGAYIGSFAGGMSRVRGGRKSRASVEHPVEPRGGRLVAVNVDRQGTERRAVDILRRHNARNVGRAEGEWRDGSWRDFDP
ncbi:MAG TPA: hypothetical protein VFC18_06705, partial [Burkholderiales bacterium]|nr:hypothetical protein [Burkholderiales bacterium]